MGFKPRPISVEPTALSSVVAQRLIAELNLELARQYPEPGANHFRLDGDEVAAGRGVFVVARLDGKPIGCGALRMLTSTTGELKRMYVAHAARGNGIGNALLRALERAAKQLGANQVVLETGERQHAAIAMYERAGYVRIDAFGEYVDSPLSWCYGKSVNDET